MWHLVKCYFRSAAECGYSGGDASLFVPGLSLHCILVLSHSFIDSLWKNVDRALERVKQGLNLRGLFGLRSLTVLAYDIQ